MKIFILVDENDIVRCMATEECNLNAIPGAKKVLVERGGTVGDEYKDGRWTAKPENYPQPSEAEVVEVKIKTEEAKILRAQAIENLIAAEKLPPDFGAVKIEAITK